MIDVGDMAKTVRAKNGMRRPVVLSGEVPGSIRSHAAGGTTRNGGAAPGIMNSSISSHAADRPVPLRRDKGRYKRFRKVRT